MIVTVGGAISGYCATGSTPEATRPASVITIEMTAAKIGRLMKKRVMRAPYFDAARRQGLLNPVRPGAQR